jgi:hypothetical protein
MERESQMAGVNALVGVDLGQLQGLVICLWLLGAAKVLLAARRRARILTVFIVALIDG